MSKSSDLFADLLSSASSSKKQNDNKVPLSQRMATATPPVTQSNTNLWPDLDLLGQLSGNGSSAPSLHGAAKDSATGSAVSSSQDIDQLFDAFNKPPEPTPMQAPQPQAQSDSLLADYASESPVQSQPMSSVSSNSATRVSKRDEALAELVDMGFAVDQANEALDSTDNGRDVTQAISYLMNAAHNKSKEKKLVKQHQQQRYDEEPSFKQDDLGAMVNELSVELKNKASFWLQTGRKTLAKGIDMYKNQQLEKNHNQPAWMKNIDKYKAQSMKLPDDEDVEIDQEEMRRIVEEQRLREIQLRKEREREQDLRLKQKREEARQKLHRQSQSPPVSSRNNDSIPTRRSQTTNVSPEPSLFDPPIRPESEPVKKESFMDIFSAPVLTSRPSNRANEQDTEMYVSSARRRPPPQRKAAPAPAPAPAPARPKISIPEVAISPEQLAKFNMERTNANDLFKKGDYTNALVGYQSCLSAIPANHKLSIVVNSNLAACYLKLGDAKASVSCASTALKLIDSYGGTPADLAAVEVETGKPVKQFWIKLLTKKAEALEHLEKYSEALIAYNMVVENGGASKQVMDGKKRCLEVVQPKPKPKPAPAKPKPAAKPTGPSAALAEVQKQTQKQQQYEAEKFQLHDKVDERIQEWKRGKEDNIRALLSSLQLILWEGANWKPVSVGDLIMVKKVKITYMKAVSKVHPDKVSQTATTEQKLIAQAVFVVLNEAWTKFKTENGIE